MTIPTKRAARSGSKRTYNLDQPSLLRLEWSQRFANECLAEAKASGSTIIRRALQVFQTHCEAILTAEGKDGEMRRCFEASQLRAANKGSRTIDLTVEHLRMVPVLKPLRALLADRPQPLKVVDQLALDISRWDEQAAKGADHG